MELTALLLLFLAVIVAVAFMRMGLGGRGIRKVRNDRARPMTEWADEREFERPQSDASEGVDREGDPENPTRL